MKKKILSLLAAFFMLFGTSAMAQVDSTLEGDVNEDGVVDIADITAVIAIIKQNAEANPTYYWYAGWTQPTSSNIATIVNEKYPNAKGSTTMNPAGKTSTTLAGTVFDFKLNPLYDQEARNAGIPRYRYFVIPTGYGIYNPNMNMYIQDEPSAFETIGEFANHRILKDISGESYKIADGFMICELNKY